MINDFELIIFDLDGTLTESKSNLDDEMVKLLSKLIKRRKIVVISGGSIAQFQKQFIKHIPCTNDLSNLYISTLTGGGLYSFKNNIQKKIYEDVLNQKEKKKIVESLNKTITKTRLIQPEKIYGKQIDDRDGQITFSAFGDKAPIDIKKTWDTEHKKREKMVKILKKDLSEFEISIGGTTSIDISRKGIDKKYGVIKISKFLNIPLKKILFVGDALFKGGNDYSVIKTGVQIKKTSGIKETKEIIKKLLK